MPTSPLDYIRVGAEVARIYDNGQLEMLNQISRRVAVGIDAADWQTRKYNELSAVRRQISAEIRKLGKEADVHGAVENAYRDGAGEALLDLKTLRVVSPGAKPDDLGIVPQMGRVPGAQVEALASEAVRNVASTHLRILRSVQDIYQQTIYQAVQGPITGTTTRRQAAQAAINKFADRGITGFIDRAGRQWDLSSYTSMAVQTAATHAAVQGHSDQLLSHGIDLVMVSGHSACCELCAEWEGKILSLTGRTPGYSTLADAMDAGLFHPHCTHTISAYIEGVTKPLPPEALHTDGEYAKLQERGRLERGIRQWKRREAVAELDPNAKRLASAKVKEWQGKLRDFKAETGISRNYGREQFGPMNERQLADAKGWAKTAEDRFISPKEAFRVDSALPMTATRRRVDSTIAAVASVHGVDPMLDVPVHVKPEVWSSGRKVPGRFNPSTGIWVSAEATSPEYTSVHEIGHSLDCRMFGDGTTYGTDSQAPELDNWRKAVYNSDAYNALKNSLQVGSKTQERVDYLLSERELFARSYAQYIGEKSGNKAILHEIEQRRSEPLYGSQHWGKDFAPIRSAFDELFKSLRLLK